MHNPLEYCTGDRSGPLSRVLSERALSMVYQPIVALTDGSVFAHEALVRGPQGMPLQSPDALFSAARREGLTQDFEVACVVAALSQWSAMRRGGRLFVNISASALVRCFSGYDAHELRLVLQQRGVPPERLVFEITEHEHVADIPRLAKVAEQFHAAGARFALDDFGDGRSSLRLWSELAPDYVKIDKYFTADIARHAQRLKTLQALLQIAETFGSSLVAEGIETADDLRVLRDLGVSFGQGYFLGRPVAQPVDHIDSTALTVVGSSRVAVLPTLRVAPSPGRVAQSQVLRADGLAPQTTCEELARIFDEHPTWHAIAFIDDRAQPLGLLGRQDFLDRHAKPFFKEIYGRRPAYTFANTAPTVVDVDADFDALVAVLMSPDQRYLTEGFIYVQNGRYEGLGTGHRLVRQVTESRLEAARHANPLTLLPGNIPISQHIDRLCAAGADYVACYADLSNFKPFNDYYGYWRGDEAIKLLSQKIQSHCDPRRDFVGHVGGDDFVMLFQSHDWESRCHRIVQEFNAAVELLYDDEARSQGGIEAEDRHGMHRFFSFISLYMGAVPVRRGEGPQKASEVANAAALAKQTAKRQGLALFVALGLEPPAWERDTRPARRLTPVAVPNLPQG